MPRREQLRLKTATPPKERHLLIYDGDCRFCLFWVNRWRPDIENEVDCAASQDVRGQFPEIPSSLFDDAVVLIETDGSITQGAEAVLRARYLGTRRRALLSAYESHPVLAAAMEWCYDRVARNRPTFSRLTRWLWGSAPSRSTFSFSSWLFLRLVALSFLIAFVSLWTQIGGLLGSHGLLPVNNFLSAATRYYGHSAAWIYPTFCWWIGGATRALYVLCTLGSLAAILAFFNVFTGVALLLSWICYLSLCSVGQAFLSFQWDALLLEAGLLAVFLAPWRLNRISEKENPPAFPRLLLWWLLCRLMFLSGYVKLASGDPTWSDLTALTYHYETQPIPTWIGWYVHHLPLGFHRTTCALMFVIEFGSAALIFLPRRLRYIGAISIIVLQAVIALTGNYTFFNILTVALALLCFDDSFWNKSAVTNPRRSLWGFGSASRLTLCALLLVISFAYSVEALFRKSEPPALVSTIVQFFAPLRSVNNYGLFAVMTTVRREIVIEGSTDGRTWESYEFPYKPGALNRRPGFVAPHQPRLDWQMWFAALSSPEQNPWLGTMLAKLLEGDPVAARFFSYNPFPKMPPKAIRAIFYEYHFTSLAEHTATGNWWRREALAYYVPPASLH